VNDTYLSIAPGVEWHEIDGSVLVLHDELLHELTGSSAEIWQAVDGSTTASDLASSLSRRHPESPGVFDDVTDFVTDLTERGLLAQHADPVGNGYRVPEHVAWVSEDDGSVALADVRTGRRHSLSPTGGIVWTMTVAGSPREVIEPAILEAFPDAPDSYAADMGQLLDSLVVAGLLERRPESP
jgi:hypothetical protein